MTNRAAIVLSFVVLTAAAAMLGGPGPRSATDPPRERFATCLAQATGTPASGLESLDSLMCRLLDSARVPGGAVAVSRQGRLVYARGFGYADTIRKTRVGPTSLFRIASLSKPFTAVTALLLAQAGFLSLDEPAMGPLLQRLPPSVRVRDERLQAVTFSHLLSHSAGWDREAHNWDPMFASDSIANALHVPAPADLDAIIRYTLTDSLQFSPGSRFAYSNVGYAIAGRLLELLARAPYDSVVARYVLMPAGIRRMQLGSTRPNERAPGEVLYYDTRRVPSVFPGEGEVGFPDGGFYLEPMGAHGGWLASVVDLMRFAVRVDGLPDPPDLLDAHYFASMLEPSIAGSGYGMGWYVAGHGVDRLWWHPGDIPGTKALMVCAANGLAFAALFNGSSVRPDRLRDQIMEVIARIDSWPTEDMFPHYP